MVPIPAPPPPPGPYVAFADRIRFLYATAGTTIPRADVGEALAELDAALGQT